MYDTRQYRGGGTLTSEQIVKAVNRITIQNTKPLVASFVDGSDASPDRQATLREGFNLSEGAMIPSPAIAELAATSEDFREILTNEKIRAGYAGRSDDDIRKQAEVAAPLRPTLDNLTGQKPKGVGFER